MSNYDATIKFNVMITVYSTGVDDVINNFEWADLEKVLRASDESYIETDSQLVQHFLGNEEAAFSMGGADAVLCGIQNWGAEVCDVEETTNIQCIFGRYLVILHGDGIKRELCFSKDGILLQNV